MSHSAEKEGGQELFIEELAQVVGGSTTTTTTRHGEEATHGFAVGETFPLTNWLGTESVADLPTGQQQYFEETPNGLRIKPGSSQA